MKQATVKIKLITVIFLCTVLILLGNGLSYAQSLENLTAISQEIHQKYWNADSLIFQNLMDSTEYQTPVFLFDSQQPGPVVLIVGGTHGDEQAGFEAAHRLLVFLDSVEIKTGKIFIIPEANKIAVRNNDRRIPVPANVDWEKGNLNRCYPGNPDGTPMEKLAYQITQLIREQHVGLFLDLHESRYFHLEQKDKQLEEYGGLGQTLIFTLDEEATWLGMVALDKLNSTILPGLKRFTMIENPIQYSGAWSAGVTFQIPGFTVETCRKLPLEERIGYQLEIVKTILAEKGMF